MGDRSVRVFYPSANAETAARLTAGLPAAVELFAEEASPERYEILISGRPTEEQLDVEGLRAVLIPFAGVPPGTQERLASRRHLALHNLHHNAVPTAELAVTLLLAAAKGIVTEDRRLRRADWTARYSGGPALNLAGAPALVVGFGAIGREIARRLVGLGMEVTATRRTATGREGSEGVIVVPAADLATELGRAQALILAAPLTSETRHLIGRAELARLPDGAAIVNVGRGELIEERALYEHLRAGRGTAGLDVWYRYPTSTEMRTNCLPSRYPFHELDNVVMTPHRAGHIVSTEHVRNEHLIRSIRAYCEDGALLHAVDLDRGY